ncbi:YceI family protein [Paracidovorax citrulli]
MTRIFRPVPLLIAAALACGGFAASAAAAQLDAGKSAVTAVARQIGVPMEGRFKTISGNLQFDPAKLAASSARLEIDVASFEIGDAATTKEVRGRDWFDAARFPKAVFESTGIRNGAGGKVEVAGKLTIKGKTVDVVVPATVRQEGNTQIFEGTLPIRRSTFNIGDGEWKDTSVVADEVQIKFRLVTARS